MTDGRLLVAGVLGALAAAGVARGSRSTVPEWAQGYEGDLWWLEIDPFFDEVYGSWHSGMHDPLYAVVSRVIAGSYLVRASDYGLPWFSEHGEGYYILVTDAELDRIKDTTQEIEGQGREDYDDEEDYWRSLSTTETQRDLIGRAIRANKKTLVSSELRGLEQLLPTR